jgi:acyl carrier protein
MVHDRDDLRGLLLELLATDVDGSTDLLKTGVVDSIGLLQLIGNAEEALGISLDLYDVDPDDLSTLDGLLRLFAQSSST